jgi:hypothetical protein
MPFTISVYAFNGRTDYLGAAWMAYEEHNAEITNIHEKALYLHQIDDLIEWNV